MPLLTVRVDALGMVVSCTVLLPLMLVFVRASFPEDRAWRETLMLTLLLPSLSWATLADHGRAGLEMDSSL